MSEIWNPATFSSEEAWFQFENEMFYVVWLMINTSEKYPVFVIICLVLMSNYSVLIVNRIGYLRKVLQLLQSLISFLFLALFSLCLSNK